MTAISDGKVSYTIDKKAYSFPENLTSIPLPTLPTLSTQAIISLEQPILSNPNAVNRQHGGSQGNGDIP